MSRTGLPDESIALFNDITRPVFSDSIEFESTGPGFHIVSRGRLRSG